MTTTNRIKQLEPFVLIHDLPDLGIIEIHAVCATNLDVDVEMISTALENARERLCSMDPVNDDNDDSIDVDDIGVGDIVSGCRITNFPIYDIVASCVREMFSGRKVLEVK